MECLSVGKLKDFKEPKEKEQMKIEKA